MRKNNNNNGRSQGSCEFLGAKQQPGAGPDVSLGCAKVSSRVEHSGRDAEGATRPGGVGARGGYAGLGLPSPVVRARGLTHTKFDNFFTRRGRARLAKRRLLCAGT